MKCALCLVAIFAILKILRAADYQIVADDVNFLEPCDKADDLGNTDITKMIDFTRLEQLYGSDGESVYLNGDVIIKAAIPATQKIKISVELLRWNRGAWIQTVFSIQRDDFCQAAFSPGELWYGLMSKIPEDQRICPPISNTVYTLKNATNSFYLRNLPSSDIAGLYKAITHFTVADYTSCLAAKLNIYSV